jgi:non-ribosomal peptide synthase protein (TIGR01720 family)
MSAAVPTDLPLTRAQLGVWLADVTGVSGGSIAESFDIAARVDVEVFRAAWRHAYAETDALRIEVVEGEHGPRQRVRPDREPDVRFIDLRDDRTAETSASEWMTRDLTGVGRDDRLFTVALFRLAEAHHVWYQRCDHIVLDGYGGALFARRVVEVYNALLGGAAPGPTPFGTLDALVRDEQTYLASPDHEADRAFWSGQLAGMDRCVSLSDRDGAGGGVIRRSRRVPAAEMELLRSRLGRSLAPALTAVFAAYLCRETGLDDITIGLPVTARRGRAARTTPAMVSNIVPVRLRPPAGATFGELTGLAARHLRQALRHERYRLEEMRHDLGLGLGERRFPGPLINIMSFPYALRMDGAEITTRNLSNGHVADVALAVYDRHDGNGLQLVLDGNQARYDTADLDHHLSAFARLLAQAARDADATIDAGPGGTSAGRGLVALSRRTAPSARTTVADTGADTEQERIIAELFAEVLELDSVGANDAFFDIGGDSVTAMLVTSRARERGLVVALRDIFTKQTPKALALVAEATAPVAPAPASAGPVPNGPQAARLTRGAGHYRGFHQSVIVQTPADADLSLLRSAVQTVADHHDLLRARLSPDPLRPLTIASTLDAGDVLRRVDMAHLDDATRRRRIVVELDAAVNRLTAEDAALFQAVWCDYGASPGRLILVAHHMVVDAVSWRPLLRDVERAWAALPTGAPVRLARTASFAQWVAVMAEDAARPDRRNEVEYWVSVLTGPARSIGTRALDPRVDLAGRGRRLDVVVPADDTRRLLESVTVTVGMRIDEVLVAALALAVAAHTGPGADGDVLIDVEGHGRIGHDVDISDTVGWFTAIHPVRLPTGSARLRDYLTQVKDRLREVPRNGVGYGALRYLDPETGRVLGRYGERSILVNHLGEVCVGHGNDWGPTGELDVFREGRDPRMPFTHGLLVDSVTRHTPGRTEILAAFRWPDGWLAERDVADLADRWVAALRELVHATDGMRAASHNPGDLTLAGMSQQEIDDLETELGGWT